MLGNTTQTMNHNQETIKLLAEMELRIEVTKLEVNRETVNKHIFNTNFAKKKAWKKKTQQT